jgi:hypothetical protein
VRSYEKKDFLRFYFDRVIGRYRNHRCSRCLRRASNYECPDQRATGRNCEQRAPILSGRLPDGARCNTNADVNYNWPGDYNPAITSLEVYSSKLVTNQYLKTGDLSKLLSGPGAIVGATSTTDSAGVTTVTLTRTPGLKVYEIRDAVFPTLSSPLAPTTPTTRHSPPPHHPSATKDSS